MAVFYFARDGSGNVARVEAGGDEPSGLVHIHGWAGFALVEVRPHELYVHGIFSRGSPPTPPALLDERDPPPDSE